MDPDTTGPPTLADNDVLFSAISRFIQANYNFESSVIINDAISEIGKSCNLQDAFAAALQHQIFNTEAALRWVLFLTVAPPQLASGADGVGINLEFSSKTALELISNVYDIDAKKYMWDLYTQNRLPAANCERPNITGATKLTESKALFCAVSAFVRANCNFASSIPINEAISEIGNSCNLQDAFAIPLQRKIFNMEASLRWVLFLAISPAWYEYEPCYGVEFSSESALELISAVYDIGVNDSVWDFFEEDEDEDEDAEEGDVEDDVFEDNESDAEEGS